MFMTLDMPICQVLLGTYVEISILFVLASSGRKADLPWMQKESDETKDIHVSFSLLPDIIIQFGETINKYSIQFTIGCLFQMTPPGNLGCRDVLKGVMTWAMVDTFRSCVPHSQREVTPHSLQQ